MIQDIFGAILEELSTILKIKLTPDKNNACLVKFPTGLMVQMDYDEQKERVIILSTLGTPAPGRYQENVYREALKANGLPPPKTGIFAYSKKQDALVLFDTLPLADLTGQKIADFLVPFMQKAETWRGAIAQNVVPSFTGSELTFGK